MLILPNMKIRLEKADETGKGEKYWEKITDLVHGEDKKTNRNRKEADRYEEQHATQGP